MLEHPATPMWTGPGGPWRTTTPIGCATGSSGGGCGHGCESPGVTPSLVERALLDFRTMPAAQKGDLMHLFRSEVSLPDAVGLWASLQWPVMGAQGGIPCTTDGWLYAKSVMLAYNGERRHWTNLSKSANRRRSPAPHATYCSRACSGVIFLELTIL